MKVGVNDIKNWVIYKITSPNGKIYIGKTSNFKNRMRHYKYGDYKRQPRIFASLNKHGFDNHKISILDQFESNLSFAGGKEMFWIKSYMTNYCKYPEVNGLNLTDGGEGFIGYKITEKERERLRKRAIDTNFGSNNKGVKYTDERKRQMSKHMKANPLNYWEGKKRSEETKKKMVENRRANGGYIQSEEQKKKRGDALRGRKRNVWWGYKRKGKKMPLEAIEKMKETKTNNNALLTDDQRKEKYGKHLIGATFNKGRKHSGQQLENIKQNLSKARLVKAFQKTI